MTKFIKLTEANEAARTILINVAQIAFIQTSSKPAGDVYIKLASNINTDASRKSEGHYFFVKEKLEVIEGMLK